MKCCMCDIASQSKFCDDCKIDLLAFVKREKERNTSRKYLKRKPKKSPLETSANLSKYGLTPKGYKRMLSEQNNKCAICSKSPRTGPLCVDHNHATGVVRELLCRECNAGIGFLQDDPWVTQKAADYLKKHVRKILLPTDIAGRDENQCDTPSNTTTKISL